MTEKLPTYVMPYNGAEQMNPAPDEKTGVDRKSPVVDEQSIAKTATEARPGWNQYRGSEQHGVALDAERIVPEDDYRDDVEDEVTRKFDDVPKVHDVETIPVSLVKNPEPRNRPVARVSVFHTVAGTWQQIATFNVNRKRLRIITAAFPVALTHDNNTPISGLSAADAIPVGGNFEIETTDPLYATGIGGTGSVTVIETIDVDF